MTESIDIRYVICTKQSSITMDEMIFDHHIRFAESFPNLASGSEYSPPEMPAHEFDRTRLDETISASIKEGMQFIVDVLTSVVLVRKKGLSESERDRLKNFQNRVSEIQDYDDAVSLLNEFSDTVTYKYFDVDGSSAKLVSK